MKAKTVDCVLSDIQHLIFHEYDVQDKNKFNNIIKL